MPKGKSDRSSPHPYPDWLSECNNFREVKERMMKKITLDSNTFNRMMDICLIDDEDKIMRNALAVTYFFTSSIYCVDKFELDIAPRPAKQVGKIKKLRKALVRVTKELDKLSYSDRRSLTNIGFRDHTIMEKFDSLFEESVESELYFVKLKKYLLENRIKWLKVEVEDEDENESERYIDRHFKAVINLLKGLEETCKEFIGKTPNVGGRTTIQAELSCIKELLDFFGPTIVDAAKNTPTIFFEDTEKFDVTWSELSGDERTAVEIGIEKYVRNHGLEFISLFFSAMEISVSTETISRQISKYLKENKLSVFAG